jgi:hypothetical protein
VVLQNSHSSKQPRELLSESSGGLEEAANISQDEYHLASLSETKDDADAINRITDHQDRSTAELSPG